MLSLAPQDRFVGRNEDQCGASKVASPDQSTTRSQSTSAGSSPRSRGQGSFDSQQSAAFSSYPSDKLGMPEYDYPMPWSIEDAAQAPGSEGQTKLIVKNTFLGINVQHPPSLEGFFEERQVQSCPASGFGLPPGLEDLVAPAEVAARLVAAEAALRLRSEMHGVHETPELAYCLPAGLLDDRRGMEMLALLQEPPAWHAAEQMQNWPLQTQAAQMPVVLDLMNALASPFGTDYAEQQGSTDDWFAPPAPSVSNGSKLELGSPEYPTVGSKGHYFGNCKPCAFLYTKGCGNGIACPFCHLCDAGEKKRRAKDKRLTQRTATSNMRMSSYHVK